jgi:Tol biopolymer transport system component
VIDLARGTSLKLTFDPVNDIWPIWSPDGSRIVWASNRGGTYQLYQKPASGVGQDELLLKSDGDLIPSDWSADGRFILYERLNPKTHDELWALPLDGDRKPFPFLQTPFNEQSGFFSPDGRWIAYDSNESGKHEVYVQTFPASGGKWQVSTKGGGNPRWRGDGKEMFYLSDDEKLMAVEIKTGSTFEAGIPKALFDLSAARTTSNTGYAVTADGQRFIFVSQMEETAPSSLAVVVNWTAELKK